MLEIARPSIPHMLFEGLGAVPTPFFFFDVDAAGTCLEANLQSWSEALPELQLAFCLKSNPLAEVVRRFAECGLWAEASSDEEMERACINGMTQAILSGPIKTDQELARAIDYDFLIAADSLDELRRIDALARGRAMKARVLLRLAILRNQIWSRFGLLPDEYPAALALGSDDTGLRIQGLSFHIGSSIADPRVYTGVLDMYAPLLRDLAARRSGALFLDIGGGFVSEGAASKALGLLSYLEPIARWLDGMSDLRHRLTVIAEPGRILVEPFGTLVTTVMNKKYRHDGPVLIVDASTLHLEDRRRRSGRVTFDKPGPIQTRYCVFGSLCIENDLLFADLAGPDGVDVGDKLQIDAVGAYDLAKRTRWIRAAAPIIGRYRGAHVALHD